MAKFTDFNHAAGTTLDTASVAFNNVVQGAQEKVLNALSGLAEISARKMGALTFGALALFASAPNVASAQTQARTHTSYTHYTQEGPTETDAEKKAQQDAYDKIFADSVEAEMAAGKTPDEAQDEVTANAKKWFGRIQEAEAITRTEVSEKVKEQLKKAGLQEEDVTALDDVVAEFKGPIETGENSMNHGKAPKNILGALQQTQDLFSGTNGFSAEDAKVVAAATAFAGMPADVFANIAKGDYATNKVAVKYFELKASSAEYTGMAYNDNGTLRYDNHRTVGQNDHIAVVSWVNEKGETATLIARVECSGGIGQPFESVIVPEQPAPEAPVAPPATPFTEQPPAPEVFKATAQVCVGLDENGNDIIETFTGEGSTQAEAEESASSQATEAAGNCTPEETTTTTSQPNVTTTTRPNTTTTTSTFPQTTTTTSQPNVTTTTRPNTTTTEIPKTCENNPETCESTTVPPTSEEPPQSSRPGATVLDSDQTINIAASQSAETNRKPGGNLENQMIGAIAAAGVLIVASKRKNKKA
jgi:hypothetical protein